MSRAFGGPHSSLALSPPLPVDTTFERAKQQFLAYPPMDPAQAAVAGNLALVYNPTTRQVERAGFDVVLGAFGRLQQIFRATDPLYGYVAGNAATHLPAIVAAEAAAFAVGGVLKLDSGVTFDIGAAAVGVQIRTDLAAAAATLAYAGTGTGLIYGLTGTSDELRRKHAELPKVINTRKTGAGWLAVAGSIGVQISNCYECEIYVPNVKYFETGLDLTGIGTGCVYNTITLGNIENNKRNIRFKPNATGWTNQNTFLGGWLSHESGEGTNVAGVRQLLFEDAPNTVNNNTFVGVSLESNAAEYIVEGFNASYQQFDNCRWEATAPKIHWSGPSATRNVVFYGNGAHNLLLPGGITEDGGATRNHVYTSNGNVRALGGTVGDRLHNATSTNNPVHSLYPSTGVSLFALPDADWMFQFCAAFIKAKAQADANERIRIEAAPGRIYFGDASGPPVSYFRAIGLTILEAVSSGGFRINNGAQVAKWMVGAGTPEGAVTGAVGDLFSRTNGGAGTTLYVKESGNNTNTGWVAK